MKLRRTIAILAFSLSSVFCQAQDWEMVSEEFSQVVQRLYHDPASDLFFITGAFGYLGNEQVGGIVTYNGEEYTSYGCGYDCNEPFSDYVLGPRTPICTLRDTLYMSGIQVTNTFYIDTLFNNIPDTRGVMRYANGEFSSMDVSFQNNELGSNIMTQYVIEDSLYVFANHRGLIADFEGFGGAAYKNYEWVPFEQPGCGEESAVAGILSYNDELYIIGSFASCPGEAPMNEILKWNGEEWIIVGPPLVSPYSGAARQMLKYQEELYVRGPFFRSNGNAGECIMKWNGEEWSDLGTGLGAFGLNNVNNMVIMNSELYVSGRFEEVGGIPAHNLAKWDGNQWCALEHDFTNTYIRTIGVYQNELYVYASTEEYSRRLWKWTGTAETCSEEFNSISEQNKPSSLTLYPNPASDLLTITLPKQLHGSGTISITDGLGRTVEEFTEEIQAGSQITIATLNLPIGLYTLKFRHEEGVYAARFVKE
ncbi:MAG: T9SS type A sorting domain-containing protein [Flavobacteriales bacterium]